MFGKNTKNVYNARSTQSCCRRLSRIKFHNERELSRSYCIYIFWHCNYMPTDYHKIREMYFQRIFTILGVCSFYTNWLWNIVLPYFWLLINPQQYIVNISVQDWGFEVMAWNSIIFFQLIRCTEKKCLCLLVIPLHLNLEQLSFLILKNNNLLPLSFSVQFHQLFTSP